MRIVASHVTRFRYSAPIHVEPHTIRLRPRSDSWQRLERFRIEIDPEPAMLTEVVDSEGNCVAHAWFSGLTDRLAIRTEFEVETLRRNPFDFLLDDRAVQLPLAYGPAVRTRLSSALDRCEPASDAIDAFASSIARQARNETLRFLTLLNEELRRSHELVVREHGAPMLPSQALQASKVACRDLAVLFSECCRTVGIAARFVSGYTTRESESEDHHMHAWAEVYLPSGGWRGYDPTQGLAVADRHVAVAAGCDPSSAAPTKGSFRGTAEASPLEVDIRIHSHESAEEPAPAVQR